LNGSIKKNVSRSTNVILRTNQLRFTKFLKQSSQPIRQHTTEQHNHRWISQSIISKKNRHIVNDRRQKRADTSCKKKKRKKKRRKEKKKTFLFILHKVVSLHNYKTNKEPTTATIEKTINQTYTQYCQTMNCVYIYTYSDTSLPLERTNDPIYNNRPRSGSRSLPRSLSFR
jgi:hypothetical protein